MNVVLLKPLNHINYSTHMYTFEMTFRELIGASVCVCKIEL